MRSASRDEFEFRSIDIERIVFRGGCVFARYFAEYDAFGDVSASLVVVCRYAAAFACRIQMGNGRAVRSQNFAACGALGSALGVEHGRPCFKGVVGAFAESAHGFGGAPERVGSRFCALVEQVDCMAEGFGVHIKMRGYLFERIRLEDESAFNPRIDIREFVGGVVFHLSRFEVGLLRFIEYEEIAQRALRHDPRSCDFQMTVTLFEVFGYIAAAVRSHEHDRAGSEEGSRGEVAYAVFFLSESGAVAFPGSHMP